MYIIEDWAGNKMDWGTFKTFDDASESIDEHVREELKGQGLDIDTSLSNEYPELDNAIDKIVSEYRGEYYIIETFEIEF